MKLPKISIVIPSYNKVDFMEDTLKSIFSQKYSNLEVIVQDGGSTDGTIEIIKKYTKKYPKMLSWESKKDKGQTDAINKGLERASGEIFTYINADDIYDKDSLKKVGNYFMQKPGTLWLAGNGKVINNVNSYIAKIPTIYKNFLLKFSSYQILLTVNYLMQPSVFLSRRVYHEYGPFTGFGKIVMEYDLWLKIGKEKMPIILNDNLSLFRINKGTTSYSQGRKLLDEDYSIAKKYTNNIVILLFHRLNNLLRLLVLNFLQIL